MENPTLLYSSSPDGALATRRRASPIAHPLCTGMTNLKNREKRRVQTPLEGKDERRRRRRSLARQEELQFLLPPQDPLNPKKTSKTNKRTRCGHETQPRNTLITSTGTHNSTKLQQPTTKHMYPYLHTTNLALYNTHRREISRNYYYSYFFIILETKQSSSNVLSDLGRFIPDLEWECKWRWKRPEWAHDDLQERGAVM